MKSIKILGTGCPKCQQTTQIVTEAVSQSGIEASIEKVEDIMQIMKYNVMSTPAVVKDDEIVTKGRVPTVKEITDLLK